MRTIRGFTRHICGSWITSSVSQVQYEKYKHHKECFYNERKALIPTTMVIKLTAKAILLPSLENLKVEVSKYYDILCLLLLPILSGNSNNIATTIKQYWNRYLSAELVSLSVECLSFASKQLTLLLNKYTNVIKNNEGQKLRSKWVRKRIKLQFLYPLWCLNQHHSKSCAIRIVGEGNICDKLFKLF